MNSLILDANDTATIATAGALLQQGRLVVLPSETVYGIALNLRFSEARNRVKNIKHLSGQPGWVIHVARPADVLTYIPDASPLARRVMTKGWPGPIALQFAVTPNQIAHLEAILGDALPETIVDGHVTFRCPESYITQEILASVSDPVAIIAATAPGEPAVMEATAVSSAIADQMDAIVDAGPTRYSKTSTLVRIGGEKLMVIRPGLIDARIIERLADQLILFVCSGNTCRSPMAAGIAARLLADKFGLQPKELSRKHIVVQSAGLHAGHGMRAAAEAVDAVRDMKVDLRAHSSQPVTRDLLRRADVIYTMTDSQRDEILETLPGLQHKTTRLDPQADIEDPIGSDLETYRQVAQHLSELLAKRLMELPL